jgi:hypothetical protein
VGEASVDARIDKSENWHSLAREFPTFRPAQSIIANNKWQKSVLREIADMREKTSKTNLKCPLSAFKSKLVINATTMRLAYAIQHHRIIDMAERVPRTSDSDVRDSQA